jgi:hypothetical protein
MADVKRNALLPTGDENGLAVAAPALVAEAMGAEPARLRAVIAIIDSRRVTVDADNHDEQVTVRFRRIELLLPEDLAAAEKLLRRALEARSGQTVLELDLEDEIRKAFEDMAEPDSAEDPEDHPDEGEAKGDAE